VIHSGSKSRTPKSCRFVHPVLHCEIIGMYFK